MSALLSLLGKRMAGAYDILDVRDLLGVTGNAHGIKNGWFCWPFNFDPIWLESCNGFTPREATDGS
jgi:hypothetical protein